ncbi:formimidoylglutamase [Pandoraea nosoerga]|uniref:Formimidoylglutamase n=1 Tax=Pandoraea nosoerga TaxID=2508296 RepID=A0A5E4SPZ0_9BURK|nr:formimidoylglutamase [Pandoraea nosoerga]MBN4665257.1 formimidoylglutamase [Pandoraea nosoerga]MBN4674658.1 formimidoylglutamase [Pandoraea nosoerga]MBN4680546.1 formimidoylglutamase [Pandoraea nosoerga]MBN4743952.1 formimidoylglutamase [Pandoraea nosoerga]VVD75929.1 formimidoylglutamase [Pandoraea nosoerga]
MAKQLKPVPADATVWRGRTDAGERGDTRRLFNIVREIDPRIEAAPGGAPVIIGFACDAGVKRNQGRAGAAEGPLAIRRALANLPAHDMIRVFDAGDVSCEGDALEIAQAALAARVHRQLDAGAQPIVLGGGHEVAWGTWQGLRAHLDAAGDRSRVLILNLDAHFDLRTARPGTSGTPFDQIAEACAAAGLPFDYACLGVSRLSNTASLFERARELNVTYVEDVDMQERDLAARLADVDAMIAGVSHVYLTIDLDVLPAPVMPGVSAPAAYGVPMPVIEAIVTHVRRSGKLRVADLAEYNPQFDAQAAGARVAARLAYRLL